MPKSMFDIIKKQNGEHFAKAIRNYDNGIFDIPNIDKIVKYAGRDAEPIMNYLVSLKNIQIEEMSVHRDPIDLLAMAGYDAYVADTLEKQNAIKKYYAPGEELCTFHDPHRFKEYYIINAVRKDVDKIKRSEKPQREDEYGTSVISIQVLKSGGFISIKNRYNHTVQNPDNTLNSNPDNIILGLSDAIKHYFNVDFSARKVTVPRGYVIVNDNVCKYNQEIGNTYFGIDFYIKDGEIHELDNNRELMLGNGLILNLATKKVTCLSNRFDLGIMEPDELVSSMENIIKDKKIRIEKANDGTRSVFADDVRIIDVLDGMITFIKAPNAKALRLCDTKLKGDLDFSNVDVLNLNGTDLSCCTDVKYNPNASQVRVGNGAVLCGKLDFSNVNRIIFGYDNAKDFSHVTGIMLPKSVSELSFQKADNLRGDIDLTMLDSLRIYESDISNANVKFNSGAGNIDLSNVVGLRGILNMQNVNRIDLHSLDLSQVSELKMNPHAESISITDVTGLKTFLNLTNVEWLQLKNTDLAQTNIKFGYKMHQIYITECKNLHGDIDFSGVEEDLSISEVDVSQVTNLKLPSSVYSCSLHGIKGLRGDLDFSNVKKLTLWGTDLSHVTSIKFNPNGEIRGLKPKDKLRFALINGTQKIKQGLSKVKQRVIKNDTRTM